MKRAALLLSISFSLLCLAEAAAFQIQKSALFVYLHEVKPIEEEGAKALQEEAYALALRKYREALRGYERIWKEYPDLPNERPYGIDRMVDESIETCKKTIDEIKDRGEAEDEFYQKLNQMVQVDFAEEDIRGVAKSLTFLTDVNVIVDETVISAPNDALDTHVTMRTENPLPLRAVIAHICRQTGLAYSIEEDHVFISTRVKLDEQK
ncbi:MAG: hypothetical protein C4532_07415 [Candidatus Abyssobacteria bacterium SURF_17]|uniref:Secretin/TonB short N-terminal domain-containing protein n=1 Tax=Candidatus Abyssobacteria bacterium SURF_17 TaxID=2093361 RepID=A0A419F0M8_9BACT|nr:MAG: hypothetical protein C4532_07415 [Candidatus Abyssubacteria bacterium SURF_17]